MRTARNAIRRWFFPLALILGVLTPIIAYNWSSSEDLIPLNVAYAGSMTSVMNGPIRAAAAQELRLDIRGQAQGAMALARLIAAGSIKPDVFVAVTPGPMKIVLASGKAHIATPIARTEMVIAFNPTSRFAPLFRRSSLPGEKPWWQVLESKGLRFGRTDPRTDPQGLNILFTMALAERYYHQPDLTVRILGPAINPTQIFQEPEVMARLQAGQLDASSAYRIQPAAFKLPYIRLPNAVNLGDAALASDYAKVSVNLNGHLLRPTPLIFYAAALDKSPNFAAAQRFVGWLTGPSARKIFLKNGYDPPGNTSTLSK
jgi:molybdate/tungstate transport system substrate-binding protein